MKKAIPLILCVVCLALLCVGYTALKHKNEKDAEAEAAGTTVVELNSEEVKSVTLQFDDDEHTFLKDGDEWKLTSNEDFHVDEDKVKSLINAVAGMTTERTLTGVTDLAQYGLDSPVQTVTLKKQDGNSLTFYFGSTNEVTGNQYVYETQDSGTVYTVSSSVLSGISTDIQEYQVSVDTTTE